jgi:hypothetical protein
MTGPDGLEWEHADKLDHVEDNGCPICCAQPGSMCSYEDSDQSAFGIEVGLYVHSERLDYEGPPPSEYPAEPGNNSPEVGA